MASRSRRRDLERDLSEMWTMPVEEEPLVASEGGSLLVDLRRLNVEPSGPRPVDSIVSVGVDGCGMEWSAVRK